MGRIVVGYDGSKGAQEALEWAADEAELRRADLELVGCWQLPAFVGPMGLAPMVTAIPDDAGAATGRLLDHAAQRLARSHGGLVVRTRVVAGHPAELLPEVAEGADLLVVGSRGHGEFAGLLIGSVGLHCAAHAPCPLVVVRSGAG
jgi:nucleotide-binding universal stress UspA family protein